MAAVKNPRRERSSHGVDSGAHLNLSVSAGDSCSVEDDIACAWRGRAGRGVGWGVQRWATPAVRIRRESGVGEWGTTEEASEAGVGAFVQTATAWSYDAR